MGRPGRHHKCPLQVRRRGGRINSDVNKCTKHGKPYPCGRCRIESRTRPPQEPPIPLEQLVPTANEVKVVSDVFGLERREKPKVTARRTKPTPRIPNAREQYNLTRRDIATLLDTPGVESALQHYELRQYRELAAGNISEEDLAKEIGMADKVGIDVYVTDLETRIIRKALFLGVHLDEKVGVDTDTFDRTMDEDRAADERDIAASGGAAIGGSIISRGPGKALDSFERGGKIRTVRGGSPDRDLTGGEVDFGDDYGEDSSA
jgi:hypothetical protein